MQSTIIVEHTCFIGGSADQVAFASSDSAILPVQNYIADSVESSSCPGGGLRLSVELPGSQCYKEGGSCYKSCGLLADQTNCVANTARLSPLGRNGTDTNVTGTATTNVTGTVAPTIAATVATGTVAPTIATMATMVPVNGTIPTTVPNTTTTTTVPPTNGTGNVTLPPSEGNDSTVRIFVAWLIRNNANITDPQDVLEAGLADAFPVFVAQVVANLTATASRQLLEYQRRRLDVSLVSASVYEVTPITCPSENMTMNMTTNLTTSEYSCHKGMGMYDLLLTSDEDPVTIRTAYTIATRDGIDDGTFQAVLLELDPKALLLLGPSFDATPPPNETLAPAGPPAGLRPTSLPTCKGKSKSKGGKGKGSKGQGAPSTGKRGSTKMMRPSSKAGFRRNLAGHEGGLASKKVPHSHFENVLKQHDMGDYYTIDKLTETEDVEADECEEPEIIARKGSKGKGKGGKDGEQDTEVPVVNSHNRYLQEHDEQRHLRDDLPRVQGARHRKHRISDIHAEVEAELQATDHQ
jgi:hypothetical protein